MTSEAAAGWGPGRGGGQVVWRTAHHSAIRYRCPDSGPRGGRMTAGAASAEDEYCRRDRLVLHHPPTFLQQQAPPPQQQHRPGTGGDPYMRRDLGYHHHYRLPPPAYFHPHPHHPYYHRTLPPAPPPLRYHHLAPSPSHRHGRCCPSPQPPPPAPASASSAAASPGGSSSSASSSLGATPPSAANQPPPPPREYLSSPLPLRGRTPPRTAILPPPPAPTTPVEYVGASGGRVVSTPTPPPVNLPTPSLPTRCAAALGVDSVVGVASPTVVSDGPSAVALCCGASRRYDQRPDSRQSLSTPSHHPVLWRAIGPPQGQGGGVTLQQPPSQPAPSCSTPPPPPPPAPSVASVSTATSAAVAVASTSSQSAGSDHPAVQQHRVPPPAAAMSMSTSTTAADPNSTSTSPPRPRLERSETRTELVKRFIRRETAVFFGVEESVEDEQRTRWLERRKRLASRKWGQLRAEFSNTTSAYATQQSREPPDVLPAGRPDPSAAPRWAEPPGRRKESVARMTFGGLAYVVSTLTKHRPRSSARSRQLSRSYAISSVPQTDDHSPSPIVDEVYFDKPLPAGIGAVQGQGTEYVDAAVGSSSADSTAEGGFVCSSRDQVDHAQPHLREHYTVRDRAPSWRRTPDRSEQVSESGPEVGCSRIWSRVLDRVFDNSDRRQYGMGVVGRFFRRSMRQSVTRKADIRDQLEDIEDHRPFFTYWVTTVQILILIISLACYGLGPVGIDLNHRSGQVLVTSLSLQQVDYQEPANFWIGPRAADLIHLGAKFAPCMRKDAKIIKEIEKGREKERETACCIRNDDSGCVQSSQADCSVRGLRPTTISTWKKWSAGDSGPGGRISGSVCGLDPKFCEAPASIAPYEWPDDITKWPICRKTNSFPQRFRYNKDKMAEHMVCEVIGHPCCIGIHGTCRITTKEYCDFVRGYFHEEASLCSQVSCLDDVCGMIPFYSPEVPDQFYRLWTSLFLHAGILHLAITLVIQYFLMRDLEKLTGPLRIAIIYLGSGMAGNLASAIFVPYRAEVGPAGAQFGLLACLIVEVLNVWQMLRHPDHALLKLLFITLVLFVFGLLPWVDNYAHLFGFIFGFLLSYALLPYISFGEYDRHKKVALIWVCLLSAAFLFAALVVLFYVIPVYDCEVCTYFNCLPLTRDFCSNQNINFKREEPVV